MQTGTGPRRRDSTDQHRTRRSGRMLVVLVAVMLLILAAAAVYVLRKTPASAVGTLSTLAPLPPAGAPQTPAPAPDPALVAAESLPGLEPPQAAAHTAPPAEPLFEGWDQPQAVLVLTGEEHGYLEPCGCTAGQVGGLGRRADLVHKLKDERHWPVAAFDVGGLLRDERAQRPQEQIKFETTRAAMREMDYDAQALGQEELRFGADRLFTLFSDEGGSEASRPKIVCANVTLFQERTADYPPDFPPDQFRIVEVGGLTIAVTAIVGEDVWSRVFPGGLTVADTLYAIEPPAQALQRVIPLIQAEQPDLMLLLSHTSPETSRDLAAQFPVFQAVVTTGGPEDGRRETELVGQTLILEVGQKGKAAGVLGIFPKAAEQKLRFQLVELNGKQFEHAPAMSELFAKYVQRLDEQHPALQKSLGAHPSGATFVGAESCRDCHQDAYDIWKGSKHAHAFDSLTKGRPDAEDDATFVARTRDPECITCHATGWDPKSFARYDSAFVDMETTPQLAGSQCENCHGPGSNHVELERALAQAGGDAGADVEQERKALHLDVELARTNLCVQCHDLDNSPKFDTDDTKPFDTFWWAQIAH